MRFRNFYVSTAVAALSVAMAAPAFAQDAAQPAEQEEAAPTRDYGEIVVTATKREQSLQDVPISMEVVGGQQLSNFQAVDMKSIQNSVPNVFVQQTAGNDVIYIRGFGSPPSNFSFDQSVSLYVDGIYAGRNRQAVAPFFDLERVEVLRGPQGALFGKNTAAGAISVVSKGPSDVVEAGLTATYNFDQEGFDITGYVGGPVTDTLGVRFAFRAQDQDGWLLNLANGKDEPRMRMNLLRGTMRWAPSENFDSTLKVEYANQTRNGGLSVSTPATTTQVPRYTRYAADAALGAEGFDNESVLISNTANLALGDWTLTSVTGYSWFDGNVVNSFDQLLPGNNPTNAFVQSSTYNSYPEDFRQFSQELRLQTPVGQPVEAIVGLFYDNHRYHVDQFGGFNLPATPTSAAYFGLLHTWFDQTGHSFSAFGQATVNISDAFRVIGSLRWSTTHKEGQFAGRLVYGPFALRRVDGVADDSFNESYLDPSATVQYDITEDVMVYATYGRGSKSGGFVSNTYGTFNNTFRYRPERSTNYEAGLKASFADRAVTLNLAAYHTQFKDLQVSVYNPTISTYQTGNAASATAKGVEGSLTLRPVEWFDISASGAYNDITYDDFPGAACLATQPVSECNPAVPASIAANNLAGYTPAYTSKWTGNVQAHAWAEFGSLRLDVTGIAAGRSSFFNSDNQSPLYGFQKGFVKYDARIELSSPDQGWHLAVVGKNLSNEFTTGSTFLLPASIGAGVARGITYVDPPRSIAVEAGFKF